jgi:hypothetical protein
MRVQNGCLCPSQADFYENWGKKQTGLPFTFVKNNPVLSGMSGEI